MRLVNTVTLTAVGSILVSLTLHAQAPAAPPMTDCATAGGAGLELVCNQAGPEDLVVLPGEQWVVASAYGGAGGIHLIRTRDRVSTRAYPSALARRRPDEKKYSACPGPPDATADAKFQTHGLWLQPGTGTVHTLFVVGHGARESIEVFEIDTKPATPVITWIGCAIAPEPIGLNSVRGLPDGGFVATNWLARGVPPEVRNRMMAGEKNGELWEWHTTTGWKKVPGSEAAGANGLELSADGKWYYVAAWGSQSFFRLSRGGTSPARDEIKLGFRVDNIRWTRDGSLLAAGQGEGASVVVKINPETLAVRELVRRADGPAFRGGTVAVEVASDLWIGSFAGDRIAVVRAP